MSNFFCVDEIDETGESSMVKGEAVVVLRPSEFVRGRYDWRWLAFRVDIGEGARRESVSPDSGSEEQVVDLENAAACGDSNGGEAGGVAGREVKGTDGSGSDGNARGRSSGLSCGDEREERRRAAKSEVFGTRRVEEREVDPCRIGSSIESCKES